MFVQIKPRWFLALALFVGACTVAQAADSKARSQDSSLLQDVSKRLLAVTTAPPNLAWPPEFSIQEKDDINAYATTTEDKRSGKSVPKVVVSRGMFDKVVQGDPDRLAFVVGHELGHVLLGHVTDSKAKDQTPLVQATFTREQEIEADKEGMALAVAAGYSFRSAIRGIQRMMDLGLEYSSFEGLGVDHPSWKDRLTLLDTDNATLWKAMSAFDNGTVFLLIEQYPAAERCFKEVTKEFPSCYEGWANLGYSLLMQYCDALEPQDLRRFDIGQIMCGGFYRRPESLEARVRGIDEDLWWEAVGALKEAVRLKPALTLAKANLGIAFLVRPAGKDVGQATRFLQEAAEAAENDTTLDPLARAAVLVNAGVADLADQKFESCSKRLAEAEEYGRRFAGNKPQLASTLGVTTAIWFNRALLLQRSPDQADRSQAVGSLEKYLLNASPASAWWTLALEAYTRLCKETGKPAKSKNELRAKAQTQFRILTSVQLDAATKVTLTEPATEVSQKLGACDRTPVVRDTNLIRLRYRTRGVDILATDQVLAICLVDENAPPLQLQAAGLGNKSASVLRVGMPQEEFERIVGDEDYDFRQLEDPSQNYRFYKNMGLAVRLRDGKVAALVVAQIPERTILSGA